MEQSAAYCDLVMKGGITSGLVYPRAVLKLSERYRFKNIGGTSVGAIAAAVCAAAALGERIRDLDPARRSEDGLGMSGLAQVAEELTREGFVFGLFQPAPAGRAAYRLIATLATGPGKVGSAVAIARALLTIAPAPTIWALAFLLFIAALVAGAPGVLAALLPALICSVAFGALLAVRATADAIGANFLGLCPGLAPPGSKHPALTEWMHDRIRRVAGFADREGAPVLFRHLWEAPLYPDEPATDRAINLQIITTDVSHSEPRTLPFTKGGFWYREDEFRRLFPGPVVDAMIAGVAEERAADGLAYRKLPEAADLPIVVAARMSLSFPLLISAVPLHEPEFSKRQVEAATPPDPGAATRARPRLSESMNDLAAGGAPTSTLAAAAQLVANELAGVPMRRCWFTDGGVSSNFPIHLFDAPLPRWPTFAIDLVYLSRAPAEDEEVFLPESNNQGLRPHFRAITRGSSLGDLVRFLAGIVGTMQNWRDLIQGRAPGHRDRIVRIMLDPTEGGLNLQMAGPTLASVARKGGKAGEALLGFDFANHYWVRYRNAGSAIERFVLSFGEGLKPPLTEDVRPAWDRMWQAKTTPGPYPFATVKQAAEAKTRLDGLQATAAAWRDAPDLTRGAPQPLPQLRIVPIF